MKNLLLALALMLVASYSFAAAQIAMDCQINQFSSIEVVRNGINTVMIEYTVGKPDFINPLMNGRTYVEILGPVSPKDEASLWALKVMKIDPKVVAVTKFAQVDVAGGRLITFHLRNGRQIGGVILHPNPDMKPVFCMMLPPPNLERRF